MKLLALNTDSKNIFIDLDSVVELEIDNDKKIISVLYQNGIRSKIDVRNVGNNVLTKISTYFFDSYDGKLFHSQEGMPSIDF